MSTETYGYRITENTPAVGCQLPPSYVWIGDEQTDERLPGTCAFETEAQARAYGKYSKGFALIEIVGERVMAGELAGEIIIRDAVVSRVISIL